LCESQVRSALVLVGISSDNNVRTYMAGGQLSFISFSFLRLHNKEKYYYIHYFGASTTLANGGLHVRFGFFCTIVHVAKLGSTF